MTHDELSQAYLFRQLNGNPMNDPVQLRRMALAMLRDQIDSKYRNTAGSADADCAELEELGESDDVTDLDEGTELDDPGESDPPARFVETRARIHEEMRREGAWYLNHRRVPGPKYLAIGRSTYYIPFFQRLAVELGTPVYQSDYMEWLEPAHPEMSLAFYLRTAERIDINLEGISPDDLREATTGIGRRAESRNCLPRPFMTMWEINQIYFSEPAIPVFWHTGGSMTHSEAGAILRARVPKERIIED